MGDREIETWKNQSQSTIFVNKFGVGNELLQEGVQPGRSVLISPQERSILNSDRCYAETVDPFQNGMLTPVTLAATSGDLADNPNHMTEDEALALFEIRQWKSFEKRISEITSAPLLRRMVATATGEAGEKLNVTMAQVRVLEARLAEVEGTSDVVEVETVGEVSSHLDIDR